jgi:nucleotide sugar dehydrogenase
LLQRSRYYTYILFSYPASMRLGFIGQGFIGKHMADDCEERGFVVVRYALEEPYVANRGAIADCDIVFIAVPTPTTPQGFDASALEAVLPLVSSGKVAVIKSTVLPGTTSRLASQFPDRIILHTPEFLREKTAARDTRQPERTIIGVPRKDPAYVAAAEAVLAVLPRSPYTRIVTSEEAELIKYGGNSFLAIKVIYMNLLYDLAERLGASYEVVAEAMAADSRIGGSHMKVVDDSGHLGAVLGRGAGGHCFPKDLAALRAFYADECPDDVAGAMVLRSLEEKNNNLLRASGKDLDLLEKIYGRLA